MCFKLDADAIATNINLDSTKSGAEMASGLEDPVGLTCQYCQFSPIAHFSSSGVVTLEIQIENLRAWLKSP
jgi:hypothetical protein